MARLPIELILRDVMHSLTSRNGLVLQAPPGAGKTTIVPLALLDAEWLGGRSIVMLEPRRLAARAAAHRMASLRGESVGNTVGYRMRGETRVSASTRIEVMTEGILTRRLQRDPTLDDVGIVIFDEFHERSLDADLGLALTLRTRALVREDLRVLVMSATLDGEAVARLIDAPIITSAGALFPVETRHVEPRARASVEATVVAAIRDALRDDDRAAGDILVFLPGAGEIRRTASLLAAEEAAGTLVVPLFGALSRDEQDRAILPDPHGRRKVVLSSAIAETSLTIEGVRIVIDAGLSRIPRFSPRTGMTRLETVRVSRASADQRRGRAGRLGPGVCYRLWPQYEDSHLVDAHPPEIANADLAPLALALAAGGVTDPLELAWLDPPPAPAFSQARELLRELDAIDDSGAITRHGSALSELPVHPRLAHMLLSAKAHGALSLACDLAALLGERDIFRSTGGELDVDVSSRVRALRASHAAEWVPPGVELDREAARRVRTESDRLARQLGAPPNDRVTGTDLAGLLLAYAYPDRVGQRRPGVRARYLLRNGNGAELAESQSLSTAKYLVAAELDDQRPERRVLLAASIDIDDVRSSFASQIIREDIAEFDESARAVVARRRERLGAIVLRETDLADADPDEIRQALVRAIARRGLALFPWTDAARRLRHRIAFVGHHDSRWPNVSDEALTARMDEWLAPALDGIRKLSDVDRVDAAAALSTLLDWRQRQLLDELAPTHIEVPSGSRIAVDYSDPAAPALAVRIQEVFGWTESPRLLNGHVPVTLHLLSPAHRPVQVTQDLRGFWQGSYFDVRKDLRGRYPKHEWPEDPLSATPTRRAKPRK